MGVFDTIDSEETGLTVDGAILLSVMTIVNADREDKHHTSEMMGVMFLDNRIHMLPFGEMSEDYEAALEISLNSSVDECIAIVSNILDDDQKLTAMVNMIDFAMADEELGDEEKAILNAFSEAFNIDDNFIEITFKIIAIKNTIY